MRSDHVIELGDIGLTDLDCRLTHDFGLNDPPAFEGVIEIGLRELQKEVEGCQQGAGIKIGDEGASAMTGSDDSERGERAHRFAKAGPADREYLHQFALWRQPVARPQIACTNQIDDSSDHALPQVLTLDRGRCRNRDRLRLCSLCHCQSLVTQSETYGSSSETCQGVQYPSTRRPRLIREKKLVLVIDGGSRWNTPFGIDFGERVVKEVADPEPARDAAW